MEDLRRVIERVAESSISVLLIGEEGVGKRVLAAELHRKSPRARGPFVALNCAAFPDSLLEAELFGYEKGSFTGSVKAKPGLLEMADGGLLLLDEVHELSLGTQAKLLGVLEDGKFLRVGGLRPRHVDVRVVSCTTWCLEAEVERGTFRRDLFLRLAQLPLVVPPLRERTGEIEKLARAFAAEAALSRGLERPPVLSPEALAELRRYPWTGNGQELRKVIERAVVFCTDGVIRPEHFRLDRIRTVFSQGSSSASAVAAPRPETAQSADEAERQRILDALAACGGSEIRAARLLAMSRRTLINLLQELGLPRPRKPKT